MRAMQRRFAVISVLIGSLALLAPGVFAVELAPGAPQTYVVRPGDTLWDIAGRFLRDPWRWSEVWRANPSVENPDLIYPGDVLELTMVAGRPVIGRADGRGGPRLVKLSPQVRTEAISAPVPTIRIGSIAPFLTQPHVADSDDIKRASYVVGFPDEHIVAGVHDAIYVRKIRASDVTQFQVLRPGDPLRDFDSGEVLGYEATFVANAVLERTGDPAKLRVTRMEREVAIGDRVIPADAERSLADFLPRPAPAGTRGRILSVVNGVSQIGQYDVVIIDRGARDRLEPGHVLEVFVGGEKERDQVRAGIANTDWLMESPFSSDFWLGRDYDFKGWRADEPSRDASLPLHPDYRRNTAEYVKPFERSGVLMVFRVFDRVSFGLILDTTRALRVGDWVAPPPA
ncbi:LysM peptidoglycan-binding domain-containing protein [Allochromatium vinosum]|uniref:LysM peptidoglycan-binding domain-containing protein n=1 Tax=Allochromatium vinosum TaxID=1049 RepID=UPI001902F767|nr:LysM domain-containing protein [Allochromatium vinosum]MBK1655613.1 peptidoglycan-binding protein [Allochromatium vinosum]